jgi:hypothetical protein
MRTSEKIPEQLSEWITAQAKIKITVIERWMTVDQRIVTVISFDSQGSRIEVRSNLKGIYQVELEDATLTVEESRLIAAKPDNSWVVFERI